jgi:hypothetical protein
MSGEERGTGAAAIPFDPRAQAEQFDPRAQAEQCDAAVGKRDDGLTLAMRYVLMKTAPSDRSSLKLPSVRWRTLSSPGLRKKPSPTDRDIVSP